MAINKKKAVLGVLGTGFTTTGWGLYIDEVTKKNAGEVVLSKDEEQDKRIDELEERLNALEGKEKEVEQEIKEVPKEVPKEVIKEVIKEVPVVPPATGTDKKLTEDEKKALLKQFEEKLRKITDEEWDKSPYAQKLKDENGRLNALVQEIRSRSDEIANKLESQLAQARNQMGEIIRNADWQLRNADSIIDDRNEIIEALKKDLEKKEQTVKSQEESRGKLIAELNKLRNETDNLSKRLRRSQRDLETKSRQNRELSQGLMKLVDEKEVLFFDNKSLNEIIEAQCSDITKLEEELNKYLSK